MHQKLHKAAHEEEGVAYELSEPKRAATLRIAIAMFDSVCVGVVRGLWGSSHDTQPTEVADSEIRNLTLRGVRSPLEYGS